VLRVDAESVALRVVGPGTAWHHAATMPCRRRTSLACALLFAAAHSFAADPAIVDSKFELFVSDVEPSARFYALLEFEVARKPDGYTTLRSGTTVIALSPVTMWLPSWLQWLRHPPLGTEIVLYTDRLDELRARLDAAGFAPTPIVRQPWGLRDFRVNDPAGYYVRVTEGRATP
jgi:hypothetical protein